VRPSGSTAVRAASTTTASSTSPPRATTGSGPTTLRRPHWTLLTMTRS
jgi:hypothetical protein